MFRMGGPIKEGIMNGIQEPKRIGYAVKGTVSASDQAKAFENIFTTPQVTQEQVAQFAKRGTPNLNMGTPKINSFEKMQLQKQNLKKYDPVEYEKIYGKQDLEAAALLPKVDDKPLPEVGQLEGEEEKRGKSVKSILEKLGYARSQKNALYDALIAGGQRISREGLGKTNLVNDLIADTSTAYDKPEKIREAAELMQVQQDLKLEGIDRSKDNRGPVQKTVEYFMSKDGGDHNREDALALAKNQAIDAYGIFTEAKAKGTTTEAVDFTASKMADAGRFGEGNVYKNRIDTKYKGSSGLIEFMESGNYNGDGVYTRGGEILLLKDGKVTSLVRFKGTGKTGFFGGEKE